MTFQPNIPNDINSPNFVYELSEAIRLLFSEVDKLGKTPNTTTIVNTPVVDKAEVEALVQAEIANINVNNILGRLAQNQLPFIPTFPNSNPNRDSPLVQQGSAFVNQANSHLYYVSDNLTKDIIDLTSMGGGTALAVGTHAARPVANASNNNTFYFETDRKWLYYSNGTVWKYVAGQFIGTSGTRAGLTGLTVDDDGALFYESDTNLVYYLSFPNWNYQSGIFIGTRFTRGFLPIGVGDEGLFYYETDYKLLWRVASSAWVLASLGTISVDITPITVLAATTADQNLMSFSVPDGLLNSIGRTLRVICRGNLNEDAGSGAVTIRFKIKLGAVTILDWTPNTPNTTQSNLPWNIEAYITAQSTGLANLEVHGTCGVDNGSVAGSVTNNIGDHNTAVVGTVDLTITNTLQVTVSFSTALATNIGRQRFMSIEVLN